MHLPYMYKNIWCDYKQDIRKLIKYIGPIN